MTADQAKQPPVVEPLAVVEYPRGEGMLGFRFDLLEEHEPYGETLMGLYFMIRFLAADDADRIAQAEEEYLRIAPGLKEFRKITRALRLHFANPELPIESPEDMELQAAVMDESDARRKQLREEILERLRTGIPDEPDLGD